MTLLFMSVAKKAKVTAGIWRDMPVAIKRIRLELLELDESQQQAFDQEIQFMQTVRHPNIVLFLGAGVGDDGMLDSYSRQSVSCHPTTATPYPAFPPHTP